MVFRCAILLTHSQTPATPHGPSFEFALIWKCLAPDQNIPDVAFLGTSFKTGQPS